MSGNATTADSAVNRSPTQQGELHLPGIGDVWLLWSEVGLVSLALPTRNDRELASDMMDRGLAPPQVADVPAAYAEPLLQYAAGEAVDPACLPVDLRGTEFQVKVWNALRRVKRGSVRTYAGIALDVGSPRGMRAVGMANRENPLAIVVPCHRIVAQGLAIGGYSGGLPMKRHLLELEGVRVDAGKVIPGQLELWDSIEK
jgi:methylated-DNA-[protein]-cysteine S-methyltransferase